MGVTTTAPAGERDRLRIRRAQRADLLAIVAIEKASFPQPWPYNAFETFLDQPGFLVAVEPGDTVVGYIVSDLTPNYGGNLGHIKDIAVHPDRRGIGIGSALLSRSLSRLTADGATTVKLEVRADNDGAKRLYRAFGFEALRHVPRYYSDGTDAVVMIRRLSP